MVSELSAPVCSRRDRKSIRARIGRLALRAGPAGLAAVAAAGLLAACGSAGTGGGSGAGGASVTQGTAASRGTVISVRQLPGVGTVLVDRSGKTLYSPQQEADGKIICTGDCLSFWFPVRVAAGATLHAPSGVTGVLGRVHRFGGTSFTWHALTTSGAQARTGGQQGNSGGYSYQGGSSGY